jgi:hypothetical protein
MLSHAITPPSAEEWASGEGSDRREEKERGEMERKLKMQGNQIAEILKWWERELMRERWEDWEW